MLPLPSSFTRNKLPTYRAKASVFPPTPVYCRSTYLAFSGICVSLQSLFFLLFFICRNWHESLRLYCASNGGAIAAKEEAQQAPSRPVAAPIPFFLFSAKQGLSSLSVYLFHPLQLLSGTNFFAISPCLVPPLPTLAYNINYALAHWARGSGGDTRKKSPGLFIYYSYYAAQVGSFRDPLSYALCMLTCSHWADRWPLARARMPLSLIRSPSCYYPPFAAPTTCIIYSIERPKRASFRPTMVSVKARGFMSDSGEEERELFQL